MEDQLEANQGTWVIQRREKIEKQGQRSERDWRKELEKAVENESDVGGIGRT